jgi:hypothetical protein
MSRPPDPEPSHAEEYGDTGSELQVVDQFLTAGGDLITLSTDGERWEVACSAADGTNIWTETAVTASSPFTEAEARAEFQRWRMDEPVGRGKGDVPTPST